MKFLTRGLLLIVLSVTLSGCALMGNQDDDSNSEQQTPNSSDSDLSGSNDIDDSAEDAESSSVSGDLRIISLMPSNTEILDALGFTEDIVGISTVDTYPESLAADPGVSKIDAFQFDAEQILDLNPTHIFSHETSKDTQQSVLNTITQSADIEVVYVSDAGSIDEIYKTISEIGTVLGAESEADNVNSDLKERMEQVSADFDYSESPKVFVQVSPYPEVFTAGHGTFINDVITEIGAENIFDDIEGYSAVSAEELMERNPEYIVSIIDGYDDVMLKEDTRQFTASDDLIMMDDNRQCVIDPDILSRPGPRIDEGMSALGECIFE